MDRKKYPFGEIVRRLFAPVFLGGKSYRRILINLIFAACMATIYAWAIKLVTNALVTSDVSLLRTIIGVLGVGYTVLLVFNRLWDKWYPISNSRVSLYLNMLYLKKYLLLDNNYVESQGVGRMQSIVFTGTNQRSNIVSNLISSIRIVIVLVTSFALLIQSSSYAARYLLFIIIVSFSLIYAYLPLQRMRRKKRSELRTEVSKYNIRFLMSKLDILQNDKFSTEVERFQKMQTQHELITSKMFKYFFYMVDIPGFMVDILRFGIPLLAVYVIKKYVPLSIGDLALMLGMVAVIDNIVSSLSQTYRSTVDSFSDVEKLWETFDNAAQIRGYDDGKDIYIEKGDIHLEHVTYNYGKGEVLTDFSLDIKGGQKTAFVGVSGSGKSTLIKILAGYIHPLEGEIFVDHQALPNQTNTDYVSLKSYYKHIGYLSQEPNVFDGTIYENLTYALDYEPTQDQVDSAINGAQCQFIYEFPDGVQTEIGEKGIKLSGGQRQRLAIAKVMLKNPQIILLDEPTSALDSFSEEEVTKAFNNLFQGRTVIVIAHRLQTVKKADRIIVLDHGKIVEEGNHDSLVKSGGVYAKMLELQSGF